MEKRLTFACAGCNKKARTFGQSLSWLNNGIIKTNELREKYLATLKDSKVKGVEKKENIKPIYSEETLRILEKANEEILHNLGRRLASGIRGEEYRRVLQRYYELKINPIWKELV